MADADAGDGFHPRHLGRPDPTVTGQDAVGPNDQHRIGEAKSLDRRRVLVQLLFRMGAFLARVETRIMAGGKKARTRTPALDGARWQRGLREAIAA